MSIGRRSRKGGADVVVDLSTTVGGVPLRAPVLCASGTAGVGAELAAYQDLSELGAVVAKSLSAEPWAGNPTPRVHGTDAGMINSVGLQNPGVAAWATDHLPALRAAGATVIASIWGRTVDEYRRAAELIGDLDASVAAVEINVSCPNTEAGGAMFAHDPAATAAVIAACEAAGRPRWAKLSANAGNAPEVAEAAAEAGADAVVAINTLLGLAIDPDTGRARLGNGGGGLSGPAIRPVAVRTVAEIRARCPELPIVGVGGIARGADALEHARAGAHAVEVGTATFADPSAPSRIVGEIADHLRRLGVARWTDVVGTYQP